MTQICFDAMSAAAWMPVAPDERSEPYTWKMIHERHTCVTIGSSVNGSVRRYANPGR